MQYRCRAFAVQRAFADTGVFVTISGSQLTALGTVDSSRSYRWVDRGNMGELYYRIEATDSGDAESYSSVSRASVVLAVAAAAEVPAQYMVALLRAKR